MMEQPLVVHRNQRVHLFEHLDQGGTIGQGLVRFAELVKTPEGIQTFELSNRPIWSALAKGAKMDDILAFLEVHSVNRIPWEVRKALIDTAEALDTVDLTRQGPYLVLEAQTDHAIHRIDENQGLASRIVDRPSQLMLTFNLRDRTMIKRFLLQMGLMPRDATNRLGERLDINLKPITPDGIPIKMRDYQEEAAREYLQYCGQAGGGGVVILPPATGKTLVGLRVMTALQTSTLIIVDRLTTVDWWSKQIVNNTDLASTGVSIPGNGGGVAPVTIMTYQQLANDTGASRAIRNHYWGLVIYDDAYRLPAKTYLSLADIQSDYRLGLTSTLARSDENGGQVYYLIGPRWYEILPRTVEQMGYLKPVTCTEIRVPSTEENQGTPVKARRGSSNRTRTTAGSNPRKLECLKHLLTWNRNTAIVSYYRGQARIVGKAFGIPVVLSTKDPRIKDLVAEFNREVGSRLVTTSAIETMALRTIETLVALSFHGGSEREEYLRLGRVIGAMGKGSPGAFYALVSEATVEQKDYQARRRALVNYGYHCRVIRLDDWLREGEPF